MRRAATAVALVAFIAAACGGSSPPDSTSDPQATDTVSSTPAENEEAAVRAAFDTYRNAALEKRGREAAAVISETTVDYYEEMAQLALTAERSELSNRRLVDQIVVLSFRHYLSADRLSKMSGRDIVAFSVERGLIDQGSLVRLSLGRVTVEGSFASGQVLRNNKPLQGLEFEFAKEDGAWRIDLSRLLDIGNIAVEQVARESNLPVERLISLVLESSSGRKPSPDIWEPLR